MQVNTYTNYYLDTCSHTCTSRYANREEPRHGETVRALWSRLSRSSPDATASQYRVSPQVELVSDLCQSRASNHSPFLLLFSSPSCTFPSTYNASSLAVLHHLLTHCIVVAYARLPPGILCTYTRIYSNTVQQWSYQWEKQKLVCKRTCLTATVVHHVLDRTAVAEAGGNRAELRGESVNVVGSRHTGRKLTNGA